MEKHSSSGIFEGDTHWRGQKSKSARVYIKEKITGWKIKKISWEWAWMSNAVSEKQVWFHFFNIFTL